MVYRLYQLRRALNSGILPHEHALVEQLLSSAELRLFARMARFDQRHALDVCLTLLRAGAPPPLLQAALLHDTGKVDDQGRPIPLVYYGLFVVLQKLAPALYRHAAAHGRGLLQPFATHAIHAERSAALAQAAHSHSDVVAILRDYALQRTTKATAMLAWADDRN